MIRAFLVVALALSACSASEDLGNSSDESNNATTTPTAQPSEADNPEPSEERTEEPTERPTPSPRAEADVSITREVVIAWGDGDPFVNYQVIAEITNSGSGWAQVSAFSSDYQVLDADGRPVTTGNFLYHSPEYIGPGEVGYLVETYGVADGVAAEDFVTVEVSGRYDDVSAPDEQFEFSDLEPRAPSFAEFEGFTVTGFVTAEDDMDSLSVIVVCVDAEGAPLGATSTNLIQNVRAGERKAFETVSSMPVGLSPDVCAELRAFGDQSGF